MAPASVKFSGPRMTFLASIATNASVGLTIGGYSISVLAIAQEFHASLTLASLGISLVVLALSVCPPLVVKLQNRFSIRNTMIAGAIIAAAGYLALSVVPSIWALLAIYALVIGPATVMFGTFAASVLVSNWYVEGRGRVLGIVSMPVMIMLAPLAAAPILSAHGLRTLFLVLAAAHVLLIPMLLPVIDRPAQVGQRAYGAGDDETPLASKGVIPLSDLFRRADFWLLLIANGLLSGSGMAKVSHLASIAAEQGCTLDQAALLMSISGGAGIVGAFAFGWLADRLGGAATLLLNAGLQVATWSILLLHPHMALLILDGFIMGACGAGVYALVAVVCSQLYGSGNVGRSLSIVNACGTPILFLIPPIMGAIHDATGGYATAILVLMAICAVAGTMFALVVRGELGMRHAAIGSDSNLSPEVVAPPPQV